MPRKAKKTETKVEEQQNTLPVVQDPKDITDAQRRVIVEMLVSGEFPTDSEIARTAKVSPSVITSMLASDPELKKLREEAEYEMAQMIERSAVNLATNGRNEIAKQKSQEFLLKKMMPKKYGDDADKNKDIDLGKRILLVRELPVIQTDVNGIPLAKSTNPLT